MMKITAKKNQQLKQKCLKTHFSAGPPPAPALFLSRDESPVSVISRNATLSNPSSASGSMDHRQLQASRSLSASISASAEASCSVSESDSVSPRPPINASKYSSSAFGKVGYLQHDSASARSDDEKCTQQQSSTGTGAAMSMSRENSGGHNASSFSSSSENMMQNGRHHDMSSSQADGEPIMCSFSASLKECHIKKLQAKFRGGSKEAHFAAADFYDEDIVLTGFPEILGSSSSFRFKERRRPASMEMIGEMNGPGSRDGSYSCSPRFGNAAKKDHRAAPNNIKESSFVKIKAQDYQRIRVFPSPNLYRNGLLLSRQGMKALPSKWEDAEKWLCSPSPAAENTAASKNADASNSQYSNGTAVPRKPKSKSGPLVSMGPGSPARPLYYSKNKGPLMQSWTPQQHLESMQSQRSTMESCATDSFDVAGSDFAEKWRMTRSNSADGRSFQITPMPTPLEMSSCKAQNLVPAYFPGHDGYDDGEFKVSGGEPTIQACNLVTWKKNHPVAQTTKQELLPVPNFSEFFPQDKHTDSVLETPRLYGSNATVKQEMMFATANDAESRNMLDTKKDAVSRRDIAVQITPLESSRTSRSTTPQKGISPVRHNTPASISNSGCNSSIEVSDFEACQLTKPDETPENTNSNSIMPMLFTPGKKLISSWKKEEEEDEASRCLKYLESGDWRKNIMEARALAWEEAERTKWLARFKREEAKITAWENHQKAKAEAELKKLEVKLEKLRSNKTEKIMNKLSGAMKKAEEMRATIAAQQAEHLTKTLNRAASLRKNNGHTSPNLSACFSFSSCNV